YERFAVTILRLIAPQIRRYPNAFGRALSALEFHLGSAKEIVILGEKSNELEKEVWREYLPNKVVVLAANAANADLIPLLSDKTAADGKPTAYVCENFVCQKPATDKKALSSQLV
ncbi:MAG: thioredoxin domain-containing protein, partial [Acidobacteriota bacterium]|nr:thioredoxin domain-containing protein [Acidobacteriota bacterium]